MAFEPYSWASNMDIGFKVKYSGISIGTYFIYYMICSVGLRISVFSDYFHNFFYKLQATCSKRVLKYSNSYCNESYCPFRFIFPFAGFRYFL